MTSGGSTTAWVRISTELLAPLKEWTRPCQLRVISDEDDVLELEVRDADPNWVIERGLK